MRRALWALLCVPVVLLLWTGFGHDPNAGTSPLLGKSAPQFTLRSIDGRTVSLASLRGRPVVINFWASWCQDCKLEHPYLEEAYRTFHRRGVDFIGISFKDSIGAARAFMRSHGGWTDLEDPGIATAIDYGVSGVPETFVLDSHGVIRFKSTGPIVPNNTVTPTQFFNELRRVSGTHA